MNTISIDKQSNYYKKQWHCDSGHSWLAVERQEIIDLGITDKISEYSRIGRSSVYLEEDCDAEIYFKAAGTSVEEMRNIPNYYYEDCFVRNRPRYTTAL